MDAAPAWFRAALPPLAGIAAVLAAPAQDPEDCPWCGNDPRRLAALGGLSHGPIAVGFEGSSKKIRSFFEPDPWTFLETAHVRWASSLGPQRLSARDRKRLEPVFEEIATELPDFPRPSRIQRLDPWERLHLHAWRLERFYERFQRILGVTDADFPATRTAGAPYMGNGPYLGEAEKFEFLLFRRRSHYQAYTERFLGVRVTDSLRWHHRDPHKLVGILVCEDSDLRDDRWLYPHLVHNMSHMMLAAYKHFSYDPPVWLDEGLAHAMEREVDPESWTREGEEGTYRERGRSQDWSKTVQGLVRRGRAPSFTTLLNRHTIGELRDEEHATCWSLVRFLLEEHPEGFARFLGGVKGQLDERGYPSGHDLLGLQRRLLREIWGWTPKDLEEAWKTWVLEGGHAQPSGS